MNQWIERYIHDVTRRLPEKDRDEVGRELRANIYDMLPEGAADDDVKEVLRELGPPAKLADQYRQGPRYLISPAVYGDYVRALKWIVPLVGVVVLVIGLVVGIFDAIGEGMAPLQTVIGNSLASGISAGISGVFHALFWTTAGFVIADRAGYATDATQKDWKVEDLPEVAINDKGRIPLSDSVAELVVTVVFCFAAILFCLGMLPVFVVRDGGTIIQTPFSAEFMAVCIPAFVVLALLGIAAGIARIRDRRWTPLVCGLTLTDNLIGAAIWLYLFTRSNIFNTSFTLYLEGFKWGDFDTFRLAGESIKVVGDINPILVVLVAIVLISTIASCVTAIYKTVKYATPKSVSL